MICPLSFIFISVVKKLIFRVSFLRFAAVFLPVSSLKSCLLSYSWVWRRCPRSIQCRSFYLVLKLLI